MWYLINYLVIGLINAVRCWIATMLNTRNVTFKGMRIRAIVVYNLIWILAWPISILLWVPTQILLHRAILEFTDVEAYEEIYSKFLFTDSKYHYDDEEEEA